MIIFKSRSEINNTVNTTAALVADIQHNLHQPYSRILILLQHFTWKTSYEQNQRHFHIPESRIHSVSLHQPLR